jgi:two-component system, OmpR family, sensor kinase
VSIRLRLTIWYVGLLAGLLIGFDLLVYSVLAFGLDAEAERTVRDRAELVTRSIQQENDPLSLLVSGQVTLPPIDPFSSADVYVQIVRRDATIARQSNNLGTQKLPVSPDALSQVLHGSEVKREAMVGSSRLLLLSEPLIIGGQIVGVVQVAQSLREVDSTLRLTAYLLLLTSAAVLIVASITGFGLAGSALEPIERIRRSALSISRTRDLTQRLEVTGQDEVGLLASTFNEMLSRLETLFKTQQRFVADVSHELRTPLTTIRGNVDLLKRAGADDPDAAHESLQVIESETSRMTRLASDLLLLAQADAGIQLNLKPVELDTVLLNVYRQTRLMATGQEIRLGAEDQAEVWGDEDRLRQLLLNFTDNAIKYTPAGGEITLSLFREPEWTRVVVKDTGIGIPAEELQHIFERFYRVDRARTGSSAGTGLGLAIAQWIAEAHGGHITVESQQGGGSTFTLWLRSYEPETGQRSV